MQVLLDHQRHERLEREASRRGQGVGATVRHAMDVLLNEGMEHVKRVHVLKLAQAR